MMKPWMLAKIEQAFFEAQLSDAGRRNLHFVSGGKGWNYRNDDDFVVRGESFVNEEGSRRAISGSIVVFHEEKAVFSAYYHGKIASHAIPFMEQAFLDAYQQKVFLAGRGNHLFTSQQWPGWTYSNHPRNADGVIKFDGSDLISQKGIGQVGSFDYIGGILLFS